MGLSFIPLYICIMDSIDFISEIYLLLEESECVIIPNFGGFITNYEPATIDRTKDLFEPPYKGIIFNPRLNKNDGLLIHYLMNKYDLSYEVVALSIEKQIENIISKLSEKHPLVIKNVGTLHKNEDGFYDFIQDKSYNFLKQSFTLHSFHSPQIVTQKTETKLLNNKQIDLISKTSKWAAIFIAFFAIGYFLYFNNTLIENNIKKTYTSLLPFSTESYSRENTPISFLDSYTLDYHSNIENGLSQRNIDNQLINTINKQLGENSLDISTIKKYCIVTGAFKNEVNAKKHMKDLKIKGYEPFLIDNKESKLNRVAILAVENKKNALELLEDIRNSINPNAWLYRYK